MKRLLALLLITLPLCADPVKNPIQSHIYVAGETLKPFELQSQHGAKQRLNDSTEYILITYDKLSTYTQNEFIVSQGGERFLKEHRTLLIVDVSVIPSGIRMLFVEPKLRRTQHSLLLSYDVNFSKMFPYKENHIAVMRVEKRKVKEIMFARSKEDLKKIFAK